MTNAQQDARSLRQAERHDVDDDVAASWVTSPTPRNTIRAIEFGDFDRECEAA